MPAGLYGLRAPARGGRRTTMYSMIIVVLLTLAPIAGGTAHCTTRFDAAFQIWLTTCSDGARAITKYDKAFKRYRTDVVRPPTGNKHPRG
jgi:hypothetical protein